MSMKLNDLFDYGYFIYQNDDYFKFSLDSVLLAEFITIKKNQTRVLDMCSGNAPIPMILHCKYRNKIRITGVELQKEIYDMGIESLKYNKFKDINFINDDIINYCNNYVGEKFDVVSTNPPYFTCNNTNMINENKIKAIARHEIKVDLESIIKCASKVIKNNGYFYMVHRNIRLADVITFLNKYNFGVKKICFIYDNKDSESNMFLIESIYNGKNYVKISKPIYLKEHSTYKGIFEE